MIGVIDGTRFEDAEELTSALWECREDVGITYDDDAESLRSRAYDHGRNLGRKLIGE